MWGTAERENVQAIENQPGDFLGTAARCVDISIDRKTARDFTVIEADRHDGAILPLLEEIPHGSPLESRPFLEFVIAPQKNDYEFGLIVIQVLQISVEVRPRKFSFEELVVQRAFAADFDFKEISDVRNEGPAFAGE